MKNQNLNDFGERLQHLSSYYNDPFIKSKKKRKSSISSPKFQNNIFHKCKVQLFYERNIGKAKEMN